METVEVLTQALEIISDPERWTQHAFAKAPNGANVSYLNDEAVRFCATGAIFKLVNWTGYGFVPAVMWLDKAAMQLFLGTGTPPGGAVYVNDFLGHAAVVRMFERAIELAQVESAVQPEPEEELVTV